MEEFLEAVADWSDSQSIPVSIARCPYDGWYASIHMSDQYGPFTATLDYAVRRTDPRRPIETIEDYRCRIRSALSNACAIARTARIRRNNGTIAHKRAG